jgi:cyclic pyranopterin phosphate synthase
LSLEKNNSIIVYCLVSANSKTGVEMEALSGVNSALLAIYDLSKIVEPNLKITNTRLLVKSGGKKGLWINPEGIPKKIKNVLNI